MLSSETRAAYLIFMYENCKINEKTQREVVEVVEEDVFNLFPFYVKCGMIAKDPVSRSTRRAYIFNAFKLRVFGTNRFIKVYKYVHMCLEKSNITVGLVSQTLLSSFYLNFL